MVMAQNSVKNNSGDKMSSVQLIGSIGHGDS